jgi:FdhD protein
MDMENQEHRFGLVQAPCFQYRHNEWNALEDWVTPEIPITLHWPGRDPRPLWAYPAELDRLAVGHGCLEFCKQGEIATLDREEDRNFFLVPAPADPYPFQPEPLAPFTLPPGEILGAMQTFIGSKGRWNMTGCFHRAGIYAPGTGRFDGVVEDIGRHNCIDRTAARALAMQIRPADRALFVSARVTASLLEKIIRAGFRMVVSRSATTTASLTMVENHGITLIGFSRENRFTVFHDPNGFVGRE